METNITVIIGIITGIIGSVTGITALVMQLIFERKNLANLKIINSGASYFHNQKIDGFKSNCYAVVSFKISNTSALPITIDQITVPEFRIEHQIAKLPNVYILEGSNIVTTELPGINQKFLEPTIHPCVNLPLRIDCFDTIYCSVVFPFFEAVKEKPFTIWFFTPRKIYKVKSNVDNVANHPYFQD